jgi:hypothetical protein
MSSNVQTNDKYAMSGKIMFSNANFKQMHKSLESGCQKLCSPHSNCLLSIQHEIRLNSHRTSTHTNPKKKIYSCGSIHLPNFKMKFVLAAHI